MKKLNKKKADITLGSSQAVAHPSTDRALRRLTSEVGRKPVYSTRYGRERSMSDNCADANKVCWSVNTYTSLF